MAKPTIDVMDPVASDEFAEAFARGGPTGGDVSVLPAASLSQMADIWGTATTARKVEVARDESKVLQKITAYAAAAGEHWFYRWPVKNRRKGTTDIVEGISIKGANAISRLFGNDSIDVRVIDAGRTFLIYAKFSDLETGYSLVRPFQQDKGGAKLGGDDDARRLDMALQIGVSKAIRNVINNALETFCTFGLEMAKSNLVGRVGKDLPRYRARLAQKFSDMGIDIKRVEATAGRPMADWLAPDVARIIAEVRAVDDGMASAEDTWPVAAPPEPRRGDAVSDAELHPHTEPDESVADSAQSRPPQTPPENGTSDRPADPAPVEAPNWRVPDDTMGQANIIRVLGELLELARSPADVDAIQNQNAERLAKITGLPKANLESAFKAKRDGFGT
jgi:hypothetical protein